MASLAERLRSSLYRARAIPGELGLRPYAVYVVYVDYREGFTDGLESSTRITEYGGQNPKVRQLNSEERALGGFKEGAFQVGPITPSNGSVGTQLSTLKASTDAGDASRFRLTGPEFPDGANFYLREMNTDSALHYTLTLERTA